MRNLEIAGQQIPLLDPNPVYASLIDAEQRQIDTTVRYPGRVVAWEHVHVDYWTTDVGVQWSQPENDRLAAERNELLRKLARVPLLDLGCGGPASTEPFREFVAPYSPSLYLGVNHLAARGSRPYVEIPGFATVISQTPEQDAVLPGALVYGDMLQVLSQLPGNSMNIALNGIDGFILDGDSAYGQAVIREVIRVAKPEGLVWGITRNRGILADLAESDEFDVAFVPLPPEKSQGPLPNIPYGLQDGYYLMSKLPLAA